MQFFTFVKIYPFIGTMAKKGFKTPEKHQEKTPSEENDLVNQFSKEERESKDRNVTKKEPKDLKTSKKSLGSASTNGASKNTATSSSDDTYSSTSSKNKSPSTQKRDSERAAQHAANKRSHTSASPNTSGLIP